MRRSLRVTPMLEDRIARKALELCKSEAVVKTICRCSQLPTLVVVQQEAQAEFAQEMVRTGHPMSHELQQWALVDTGAGTSIPGQAVTQHLMQQAVDTPVGEEWDVDELMRMRARRHREM